MDKILFPLEWVVAWILAIFHKTFTFLGLSADGGWTWFLSIAFLTILVRAVLIPLFVYQIKAQRKMQLMQPEIQKLQAKYKGKKDQFSRQQMAEEQQALFKKHGTNPFASCLPMLVQMPIFFSLFRVIRYLKDIAVGDHNPIGGITQDMAQQAEASRIFGISLSDTFMSDGIWVKCFTAVLIILMAASQFYTQKQMMSKNMSEAAMNNPFMQQQKMMLYLFPVVFAVGGIYFPLGVLIYWLTTNFWTMCQQMIVLRNMPAPGSKAEKALHERQAAKAARKAERLGIDPAELAEEKKDEQTTDKPSGQRQQPVGKARQKKKNKK